MSCPTETLSKTESQDCPILSLSLLCQGSQPAQITPRQGGPTFLHKQKEAMRDLERHEETGTFGLKNNLELLITQLRGREQDQSCTSLTSLTFISMIKQSDNEVTD